MPVDLNPKVEAHLRQLHQKLLTDGKLLPLERLPEYYHTFRERFGPERLATLDGEVLLETIHGNSNFDSLVYWLEFKNDEEFPAHFGSIAGGSAYKFIIYRAKESGQWITGNPKNPQALTTAQAIDYARRHRDQFIKGAEVLTRLPVNGSDDDYARLQAELDTVAPDVSRLAWGHKYFSLLFPDKLDDYHNPDYQRFHLIKMQQIPPAGEGRYLCAGRYVAIAAQLDIPINHLTATLNHWSEPYQYWRVGTSVKKTSIWPMTQTENCVAVGWNKISDLSGLTLSQEAKDHLRDEIKLHYSKAPQQIGKDTKQLFDFAVRMSAGDLVCAANGKRVLGIGRVTGDYYYVPGADAPHRRPVEWLWRGEWHLPIDTEGIQTTFHPLRKTENRVAIEAKVLNGDDAPTLAFPFNQIFADRAEAEWAFDFLAETLAKLGVFSPDDERFSLTIPQPKQNILRLNFGNWAVCHFDGPQADHRLAIALFEDRAIPEITGEHWEAFAGTEAAPIAVFNLSAKPGEPLSGDLQAAYDATLADIATRFANWQGRPYRKSNQPAIAAAVFDASLRDALFENGLTEDDPRPLNPELSLEAIAGQTGFELAELQRWVRALERKKQVVLYGPPGTGKTFIAEHLARHAIGGGDGFSELVQFHPAYAYEDFMQGIRPETGANGSLSYKMKRGRFLDFCARASERDGVCVLIIDEINRANLARVFGELMYLLEYRGKEIPLAGGRTFRIPPNVRIIGTMNTADRSIALVDHALRRRFAFLYLPPNYDVLRLFHQRHGTGFPVESLIIQLQKLNQQIDDRHYEVGISFFLRESLADDIADIWQMEIEPYLEEYFFDRPDTVNDFRWQTVRGSLGI